MTVVRGPLKRTSVSFLLFLSILVFSIDARAASRLDGRVLDPDGRPVANAEVVITGATAVPQRVTTDDQGRYVVPALPAGRYLLRASAPGMASDAVTVIMTDEAAGSADIPLRVSAVTETLVVSAAQIDQALSRTPDSVTVIDGRQLDTRQQFTLGAALRSVPGLTVQQSGGPGTLTSLFTRGGESDFTLVLVDGVRANAFGGGIDLSQVALEDVERIEVVRGPQSALYGSDAIGGVVQVITRTGGRPSGQALVEGGSRDLRRASGSTTGELNGIRWNAGASHLEDQGFRGQAANGQAVTNDQASESQVSASLGWRHPSNGADLQGSVLYVETDRGSPGPYGSDPASRFGGVDTVSLGSTARVSGGVRWMQPWFGAGSRVRQRVELDVADYDLDFVSPFGMSTGNSHRTHARVQTDVAASAALGFSAGLEWLDEQAGSTYITSGTGGAQVPVDRGVLGVFGEGRWAAGDRVSITAGLRGERISRAALPGDPLAFSARPAFPQDTITSVNPKIAAAFLVSRAAPGSGARAWTRLRGAFGTGIRPPDAFEIAFTDNPSLKPERSRSGEIGATQALAGGAIQLDATAFVNSYSDLIISVGRAFAGSSRYRTDNISNARARGIEASAAARVARGFDLRAGYTFLDTAILAVRGSASAPTPYTVGDALLRRPRHQGSLDVAWTHARAGAFAQVIARGEALDAEPAFGPTGGLYLNAGHAVANLGASWKPRQQVEVFARMLNLFDRGYEEVLGYPAPGRTAYVGARVAVGR